MRTTWIPSHRQLAACVLPVWLAAGGSLCADALNHVVPRGLRAAQADCPLEGPQRVEGQLVVMEHDGSDYSWTLPDGTPNYQVRACVARRFYQQHADAYDFIVVYTNFEFETGQARAFYNLVRNDVHGIGKVLADNGPFFGSPNRLKGYIDMAALSRWVPPSGAFQPGDPAFATAIHVLAHEVGHQWLAQPRYRDSSGTLSPALLGRDGAHWSYLLDSDASHVYGADWVEFSPGRYRAERIRESYSPLDLYLMGLLPAARTPAFTLLRSDGIDTTALPVEGAEVEATPELVTVDDVVAAEGPRQPDAQASQKEFRLGFVLLVRPGSQPTTLELQAVERLRESFQGYFFAQTRAVGVADTSLAETPPGPPLPEVDLDAALVWLLARQSSDGRWEDLPRSGVRDTSLALEALDQLGQAGAPYQAGRTWIAGAAALNTDFVARRSLALAQRPLDAVQRAALVQELLRSRQADGGFGPAPGYGSTALDTALALRALRALDWPEDTTVSGAVSALASLEVSGGGFAAVQGRGLSTLATAEVLLALLDWPEAPGAQPLLARTLVTLLARRNSDGGFGESPSTAYATALALRALSRAGLPQAQLLSTIAWLKAAQRADGSWGGSRYETALGLAALRVALGANLGVPQDSLAFTPAAPREGEVVQVTAQVKNTGRAPAGATHARLYLGALPGAEVVGELPVPALAPGESASVEFAFDTLDRAGVRTLYVMADGRSEVEEAREDDNTASLSLTIQGLLPDLELRPGAIQVSPDPPVEGETAQVAVTVRNAGERRSPAGAVLRLVLGNPRLGGQVLADVPVPPIEAGSAAVVTLAWDTTGALGEHLLYAVADATYVLAELDEANNESATPVQVVASPPSDPELALEALTPDPGQLSTLPQTVTLHVRVKNRGLTAASTSVAVYDADPPSGPPVAGGTLDVGPRQSQALDLSLTIATPGTRHLLAVVDPDDLIPEEDEENNSAAAVVVDAENTVDLELLPADVVAPAGPLVIGDLLEVTATVRNRGTSPVSDLPVTLNRSAADGGAELARAVVALAPGAAQTVTLAWTTAATGSPLDLQVRVDPFGTFPELSETNNDVAIAVQVQPSSLPNLRASGADVLVVPDPPLQGGAATVSARVSNPAVVAAGPFHVALFRGDPDDGGTLIGDQGVPGLEAGAAVELNFAWPQVDVQGVAGLFVVADAGDEVQEYDEDDNVGFRPLAAIGLPDLALTTPDVGLEPPFPHSAQPVEIRALVRNLGPRPAPATLLRVFEGQPDSGSLVAELTVPALDPLATLEVVAPWTPSGAGEHPLALVLDPDDALPEADEGNNLARVAVVVQDADLYLTAPYFSPDGDGVRDETTLAWRTPGPVDVALSDNRGRKLRDLAVGAPAQGTLAWDGRDEGGRLVTDGEYTFSLRQGGTVLKRVTAVLDTNRLPIHAAAGTGRTTVRNLTCALPDLQGPAWMPAEDEALFLRRDTWVPEYPPGLLRVTLDGDASYLFQDPWYAAASLPEGRSVSPDGRELLLYQGGALHAVDLASGERRQVAANAYSWLPLSWSPDGQWIALEDRLLRRDGELVAELPVAGYYSTAASWSWSPDSRHLARGLSVVSVADPANYWTAPIEREFVDVRATEWRGDGSVHTLLYYYEPEGPAPAGGSLPPRRATRDGCDPEDPQCQPVPRCDAGCSILYEPFGDDVRELPWLAARADPWSRIDWSPAGDRVLYSRYRQSIERDVSEVAAQDGSQALELARRALVVSPLESLGYQWSGEAAQPGGACQGAGYSDLFVVRGLDNLSVDFHAARLPGNSGVLLTGVVSDRNLESWQLEFAATASPQVWHPLGPSSDAPVLEDVLTAWVPPSPGTYAVRLTAADLAGNRRTRTRLIAWDRYPSITNITQTEFLISPNGDGVKDQVRFDYFVQEPTRLDVRVVGPLTTGPGGPPPVVRRFAFEYPDIGARSFAWDGRGEQGALVPDGRYQVLLNEVPLRVEVDVTPPDLAFAFRDLRSEAPGPEAVGELRAERAWHVVDRNLKRWQSPVDQGVWPQYDPVRDQNGDIVYDNGIPRIRYENGHAADLVEDQEHVEERGALSGLAFWAVDRAGNRAEVPVPPVPERLVLLGAEDDALQRVLIAPPVDPARIYPLVPLTRFRLAETATDSPPAEPVRFQYQSDVGGPWQDAPAQAMQPQDALDSDFVELGLDLSEVYRGRFACEPANGHGELLSEVFRFRPCERYMVLTVRTEAGETVFTVTTAGVDVGSAAWLKFDFASGPSVEIPMTPIAPGVFEAFGPFGCTTPVKGVSARVLGTSGSTYPRPVDDTDPCIRLVLPRPTCPVTHSADLEQVRRPCADSSSDRIYLSVLDSTRGIWVALEGDPDGTPFPIAGYRGLGRDGPKDVVADVTGRPHGPLTVRLTLSAQPGSPVLFEKRFQVFVDRSPPLGEVLQPAEGAVLCVSRDPQTNQEYVPFVVQATDDAPKIEISAEFRRDGEPAWRPVSRRCTPGAPCSNLIESGEVAALDWIVTGLQDGDYTARITFCDRAGNKTRVERRVSLNRQPPHVRVLHVLRPLFSPNGDGRADLTTVSVRLAQAVNLSARVYAATPERPLVRVLFVDRPLPAGDHSFAWDGRADDGAVVPDGRYVVAFRAQDACGREGGVDQPLEVDNTPPVAEIGTPPEGGNVAGSQDVRGVAFDRNLQSYELAASTPGSPWAPFGGGTSPQGLPGAPVLLQRWLVPPGEGPASLRLRAVDKAENSAEALVNVVRVPPFRLGRLTAYPALFSPNGDGRRESTTLEYALLAATRVTLEVRGQGGALVKRLVSGVVQDVGVYALPWDGLAEGGAPAPDDEYLAVLVGEAPEGGAAESSEAGLIVDRLPPAVVVEQPAAGSFVGHDDGVLGSVQDARLSSFVLTATPPGGAAIELARGNSNQPLSQLAALATLTDGPYDLALEAEDQAENRGRLALGFVLDSIPPSVAFHAPLNGAVLRKGPEPQPVSGAATDQNLREWLLGAGPGTDPAYFVEVRRAPTGGYGIPLGPWVTAALPDGTYTLRLSADDRAGHDAEARLTVDLDGTPPVAAIAEPAAGQCLRAPAPVVGTATDAHLEGWELESAPGPAASAYQWSPVGSGTTAVTSSPLADWNPLPPDGVHTLRLTVRDQVGFSTPALRTVRVDTLPPPPPSGLASRVRRSGPAVGDVTLTWAASPGTDVAGYRVRRDGEPLAGLVGATTFTDSARPEGRYVYQVLAEDDCGNASEPVSLDVRVDVTPPLADILRPVEGASVSGSVEIRGTAWSGDDFKEYRLFVGAGQSPEAWTPLGRSTLGVLAGPLGNWTALGEGLHTLALEAEDLSGNVARVERGVVVDNQPPGPPVLVSVDPGEQPSWLVSTWTPPPDTDVEGYLLYRNGRLANATGVVIGDLRPYLLPGLTYLDKDLPDGQHCYHVVAMDHAGNLSPSSNTLCRTLQNRPPHAEIVQPGNGARFQHPLRVVAFTPDLDVVRVQFQYKAHADTTWLDLGAADTQEPWETTLDPAPLALGDYDLRAVATDTGNLADPAPGSITVTYGDTTPPPPPLDLVARADVRSVRLTWSASAAPDLTGYHVYLGGERLTTDPVPLTEYQEERDAGSYTYTVTAVDGDGNESQESNAAQALVYALTLDEPFPVTLASTADLTGGGTRPGLTVELSRDGNPVAGVPATGEAFSVPGVALEAGGNVFVAQAVDGLGDHSIPSNEALLIANTAPPPLAGLSAVVDQRQVTLSWDASAEPDLFGYALRRDGQPLTPTVPQTQAASISASSSLYYLYAPPYAFDGSPYSAWLPDPYGTTEQHWQVDFLEPVLVERVEFDSVDGNFTPSPVSRYRIEALWEGRYVPLAVARQNGSSSVSRTFPWPFATQSLRIVIGFDGWLQGLSEVRVFRQDLVPAGSAAFVDADVPDGQRQYEAAAVDRYGAYGPWAPLQVPVGDVSAPAPPSGLTCVPEGSDAVLGWDANTEPDLGHYLVWRDGTGLGSVTAPALRDGRLPNGVYSYTVAAVDAVGNQSAPSAAAQCTIDVAPPATPVLQAEALANGTIRLAWEHPGAARYVLSRSTDAGGPYAELVRTPTREHRDATAVYNVRHYYVVRALDELGNASPLSNEASAVPLRTEPPPAPVILFPTDAAHPTVVEAARTSVRGSSEVGTIVSLSVDGQPTGTAVAQPLFTPQGVTSSPGTGELVLDRDGRLLAFGLDGAGLAWRDLASGVERTFNDPAYPYLFPIEFAPGGGGLLYRASPDELGGQVDLFWLDLAAGVAHPLETGPERPGGSRWSPDGTQVAYSTSLDGTACPLQLLDLAAGSSTVLYSGPGCADSPVWSADGTRLAFTWSSGNSSDLLVLDLAGGAPLALGEQRAFAPAWSPDGLQLAYFTSPLAGNASVRVHDFGAGTTSDVTDGARAAYQPMFSSGGRWLAWTESFWEASSGNQRSEVVALDRPSGARHTLASGPNAEQPALAAWTRSDYAVVRAAGQLSFLPGFDGSFELPAVPLQAGQNLLVARARDPRSGLESPDSLPVQVTVPATLFPDLAVDSSSLGSYPAVPLVQQPSTLLVRVRNLGGATASDVGVHVWLVDPAGQLTIDTSVVLPTLAPGPPTVVTVPWTPGLAGFHALQVIVDEADAIAELDEDNNAAGRGLTVMATAGLAVSIDSDRLSYPARTDALAFATIVNGGAAFNGTARTSVADAQGQEVALLDQRQVSLSYGQPLDYVAPWNTGTTYAGAYAFELRLFDQGGGLSGFASRSFAIEPDLRLAATLRADAASVPQGVPAGFHGQVDNLGVNAPLQGLEARLAIVPEGSATAVYESDPVPLPLLLPAGSWQHDFAWPAATPGGRYVGELRVSRAGGAPSAVGRAPFEVVAPPVTVTGTLAAVPNHVLRGASFDAQFTVTNDGSQPLPGYPLSIEVVSGAQATVLASQALNVDLAPGQTLAGMRSFSSSTLVPGRHSLRLRGGTPALTLARAPLRVHGPIAPPSIDSPADGAVVDTPHPLLVVNNASSSEGAPLVYEFQVFADPGLQLPLPGAVGVPETPARTSWRVTTNLAEDNVYYWRARAGDGYSLSAWSAVASFRLDSENLPPAAPVPDTPEPGGRVASRQPTLVVANAFDPENDALTYDFRLASDAQMATVLVSVSGLPEGPGLTSWSQPLLLDEDATYWWSARAFDGRGFSSWCAPVSFMVDSLNLPPGAPTPLRPVGGVHVPTLTPDLAVANASDPEGAALVYRFELDLQPSFDTPELQASPLVPEGLAETGWVAPVPLRDDTRYYWRASASDGHAFGPWASASFFVSLVNDPPGAPVPLDPVDGRAVPTPTPTLLALNASDAEGDPLTYEFSVTDASGSVVAQAGGVPSGPAQTAWPVAAALQEDQLYSWRARAHDPHQPGPWSAPAAFRVNAVIPAPGAPGLISPPEGSTVAERRPPLVVSNAASPEGLALTYTFELYSVGAAGLTLVDQVSGLAEGAPSTSWTAGPDLADGPYSWRARATDSVPQDGPWMDSAHFTVAVDVPPAAPLQLVAVPGDGRVTLAWNASPEPDVIGYSLYRSQVAGGPYAHLADTTAATHLDTAVVNGSTYYYVVTARDAQFESERSNEAAATPQGQGGLPAEVRFEPPAIQGECLLEGSCRASCPLAEVTDDADPDRALPASESGGSLPLRPILECVVDNFDGTFTALFGYKNENPAAVDQPVGSQNRFSPAPQDRGQPTRFLPGRTSFPDGAFEVPFGGSSQVWTLRGRTSTASRNSKSCSVAAPAVECPQWLLATIELPAGQGPELIDRPSLRLAGQVPADPGYGQIVDRDGDGLLELEVRFAFEDLVGLLQPGQNLLALSGRTTTGADLSGSATVTVLPPAANLWFTPRTLQRSAQGQWVQAQLRVADCLDAKDIDVGSLLLNETVPVHHLVTVNKQKLIVKFDRAAAAAVLPDGERVEVRVSGSLHGQPFVARDHIRVIP